MTTINLALRNIAGSSFRSWVVGLCMLLVAGLFLSTSVILGGAQESLQLAMDRLGADIIVVPEGATARVESALLMGGATKATMPFETVDKIGRVTGVAAVSPQLYLETLKGASCCSASEMFLVAFDPETDFTLRPWLERNLGGKLGLGEAVGGQYVYIPTGEQNIKVYGYFITLKGNLEPTGTNLDQSLFFTFDTARDVARLSPTQADKPLDLPASAASAALVKVSPGADPTDVALRIVQSVPGVTPIESPQLFLTFRQQISGLLGAMGMILGMTGLLSLTLIGLVFAMASNERRREIGVLRALGATPDFVFRTLIAEAALLAGAGAVPGLALAALTVYLFRNLIIQSLGVPFLFPSLPVLLLLIVGGLVLALAGVSFAVFLPAYKISRQDPATSMRE